jgi:phage shock protein PspC (stress-responsive transcriptional regulator)
MERVVTINLNGNPYQLEEPAYDAVRAYLQQAEAALADNPDKAEVMRDLEQAIADKCAGYLSATKTVVAAPDMSKILEEMGPVQGDHAGANAGAASASANTGPQRRRLYRITEGAQVAGVCAGIAAFFDIDVNVIRLLFIIATIFSSGAVLLVYIAMMFLIPSAQTSEQWAAAHGVPFNAQDVIDRAKREYAHFASNGPPWTWSRWQRRQYRREMKARWRAYRWGGWHPAYGAAAPAPPPQGPVSYSFGLLTGVLSVLLALVRAILLIVFLAFLFALVTTGHIGWWFLPAHLALWQAIVGLILIYVLITIPLRALRWALRGGHPYYGYRGAEGLVTIAVLVVLCLIAYNTMPEARQIMDNIPDALARFGDALRNAFNPTAKPFIN